MTTPKPQLQPNSVHVSLRGVPVGEPIFRECDHEELGWGCQGKIKIEAGDVGFTAYRFLTDREKLQKEFDAIIAAGEVQVTGMMENGGVGDELLPEVIVEHWEPVHTETHKEPLLNPAGPRQASWPQKPAPEPAKRLAKDTVQVALRGQPISEAVITATDGDTPGMPGAQFYDATFKLLSNDTVFRVYKSHHKPEELDAECNAIWKARDVQVSGIMMSASKDDDYDMAILVDHWTPITEEADAAAP